MKSCIWLSLAVIFACSLPLAVQAADDAAVLGVRSLDGDTDLERTLSTALRSGVASDEHLDVTDRELSLEQMSLAHGCDEPDARCLGEIAKTLSVVRLFFGTVVEATGGGELTLYAFDARSGKLESAAASKLEPKLLSGSRALGTVSVLLKRLNGEPESSVGHLRITGGQPGAEIFVDGVSRGKLAADGSLTIDLNPGKHFLLATGPGRGVTEEHTALVSTGATLEIALSLGAEVAVPAAPELTLQDLGEPAPVEKRKPASVRRILGWTSLGVSAAFAVATIYSWVRIGNINDDPDYLAYRAAFPRKGTPGAVSDVCHEADQGTLAMNDPSQADLEKNAKELCDEGDRLEVLQYVFASGAVLAGGTGAYLLWSAKRHEKNSATTLSIQPRVSARATMLEAVLRF